MATPKINIKNFSGMGNGTYYLDRMESQKIAGQDILTTGWNTSKYVDENDTGFGSLNVIDAFNHISYGSTTALNNHVLAMGAGIIFDFHAYLPTNNLGILNTVATTGSGTDAIAASVYPDITTTTNNHILYTSAGHLGRGYVGTATGGSTTTLIDTTVNFDSDLGMSTTAGINKVYNATNKEIYTITSITTTTNTNDTINFSTTTTAAAGDIYIAFRDNFQKFGVTNALNNHFVGQPATTSWVRQIKLLGDDYWALNGNYISSLNIDESTWAEEAKQLPYQTQATCFDINNANMLVGGNYQGQGKLMLWDTYSAGWLSILDIDMPPDSIRAYGSGWIVMTHNKMFYTDGYQINILTSVPDMDDFSTIFNTHYNGIEVIGKNIIISADPDKRNRARAGIWIYNIDKGWSYTPFDNDNGAVYTGGVGAVGKIFTGSTPYLFTSVNDNLGTNNYIINNIFQASGTKYSAMFYIKLPEKMRISSLELNLSPTYNNFANSNGTTDVTVSYGDGKDSLWDDGTVKTGSSASSIINSDGVAYPASVGQEVTILQGNTGGEKTWIQSITGAGTDAETWAVSPSLSGTPDTGAMMSIANLNFSETKTITSTNVSDSLMYNVSDFYSDNLLIEVSFEVKTGATTLDLHSINIY